MARPNFTTEELQSEEWRNVVGYEGYYDVSTLGRVCSLPRKYVRCIIILRPCYSSKRLPNETGYGRVSLHKDGRGQTLQVHQIVARAFLGPCPEGMEVNHKGADGDKGNSRLWNLEYTTRKKNAEHANQVLNVIKPTRARGSRNGRSTHPETTQRGERSGKNKLTDILVLAIRQEHADGRMGYRKLAKKYGMHRASIRAIILRISWAHI